jgi:cytochrome c oxidase subunit 2
MRLKGKLLGESGSIQGDHIDTMIEITLWVTGFVFVLTQILLFWFAFKYQESDKRKAYYFPHDKKLELIWTVIPAIVLTVLVGFGLYYWFQITGEAPNNAQVVEVTGSQFKWEFRYPGKDGILGKKYYKNIKEAESNPLGQIWDDKTNQDDIYTSQEVHIVVNKPVKFVIGAKDVIHDVGLAHFRLKMDAVPGIPTTLWFTPKFTTAEMRKKYGPDFNFEISCDQMCGAGHFGMRGVIVVESQAEFDRWLAGKQPQYVTAHAAANPAPSPTQAVKTDSTKAISDVKKTVTNPNSNL